MVKIPKLRFKPKNGGIFPAWSEKTLAELTDVFKSGQGITSDRIRAEGEYPVYGGNGLRGYAEEFTHDGYYALIGRQGALCGNINTVDGKTFISEHAIAVKAVQDSSTEWLAIKLELMNLNRLSESSAQPGLAVNKLLKLKVNAPCIEEQEKIAAFIGAIDQKISLLTKKHKLLIQYKKGVMQKIFNQEIRFKDEGGEDFPIWNETSLGEVADIHRGASPRPISDKKWFSSNSKIGWVRISDVTKSSKFLNKTEQYLSADGVAKSRLIPKGSIIMSICATIGKPIYTNLEACIHDGFVVFEDLKVDSEYFYYYLEFIENFWYRYGQPGSQVNLNTQIVSNELISIPHKDEQLKIAKYLSSLDQKINVVKSQLDLTKQYKQGLLQQMFI